MPLNVQIDGQRISTTYNTNNSRANIRDYEHITETTAITDKLKCKHRVIHVWGPQKETSGTSCHVQSRG